MSDDTDKLKIYTRMGDDGDTWLVGAARVGKDEFRVSVLGDLDELNSVIGLTLAHGVPAEIQQDLHRIQNQLFALGARMAGRDIDAGETASVDWLETRIDRISEQLPPLRNFILPGGNPAAASCHLARAVCRRAERHLIRLSRKEKVESGQKKFINRLSDYLFVAARLMNKATSDPETRWTPGD